LNAFCMLNTLLLDEWIISYPGIKRYFRGDPLRVIRNVGLFLATEFFRVGFSLKRKVLTVATGLSF
jgi:hypothetical protein